MKALAGSFLKSRITQGGLLLALVAAAAATIAWSDSSGAAIKLEGAWVGQVESGIRVLATFAPTDPSGQSAVFRIQMIWPPELLAGYGIEAVTDEIGEEVLTGINTAAWTGIWYGLAGGRRVVIFIDNAVITMDSPTHATTQHTLTVYLASADADNDGYPDPGSTPVATLPRTSTATRVTH